MPGTHCCVPLCNGTSGHKFPGDVQLKKRWINAVKRDKWQPTKWSVVCQKHFTSDDYISQTWSGDKPDRKRLKKGVCPSMFAWSIVPSPSSSARNRRRILKSINSSPEPEMFPEFDLMEETVETSGIREEEILDSIPEEKEFKCDIETQSPMWAPVSIERFMYDDAAIHYYTGLENYKKFTYVFSTLGSAAFDLSYRWNTPTNISIENQFFLTMIKLRCHTPNQELAMNFSSSIKLVSNIFVTWVNFMYHMWKEVDTWPDQELTRFYIPDDFKKLYSKTRLIVDGTEIPIQKPKNPKAQQASYSTYKNRNTLKIVVGASPGGLVSYIPDSYGGSASDRAIVERSDLFKRCDPKDELMADKGFNVQDMFAPYDIGINMPTFLKGQNQFNDKTLKKDRKVASKRVHIERIIGLAKTYKILKVPLNHTETKLGTEIYFVCFMLCNYRTCIVPTNA